MFLILCARQCRAGISGWTGGGEAVAAVRADHFEALAGGAAPVEGGGQALPFGGAFAAGGLEVDDSLAPVGEDAGGDRHGTPDGFGTDPARRYHVIEQEGFVAVGEGMAVEGGDAADGGR